MCNALYAGGALHLLPFPGSLVFWGSPQYRKCSIFRWRGNSCSRNSSRAMKDRVAFGCRNRAGCIIRASTLCIGRPSETFHRTHRWQRVLKGDDATEFAREDHLHTVLFSTHPDDVGLYGKPMARNAQIWSRDFRSVLNGPAAGAADIQRAIAAMENGGAFGYRFFYPPMQTGPFTHFWHRPLIAFRARRRNAHRRKQFDRLFRGHGREYCNEFGCGIVATRGHRPGPPRHRFFQTIMQTKPESFSPIDWA